MAILVKSNNPISLIHLINKKIEQGEIDTWIKTKENNYTHATPQWVYHAWMHPYIEENRIIFGILGRKDCKLTTAEYAVYHGRFVEMLLSHFDNLIFSISVSPGITSYDNI